MKFRRRIRRAIKWTGTVVTVLLLVVWIGSAWCELAMTMRPTLELLVWPGQFFVGGDTPWSVWPHGFSCQTGRHDFMPHRWWIDQLAWPNDTVRYICIPIWIPAVLAGVPTLLVWRRDRRRRRAERANMCPKCGYDLRGRGDNAGGHAACPECGDILNVTPSKAR